MKTTFNYKSNELFSNPRMKAPPKIVRLKVDKYLPLNQCKDIKKSKFSPEQIARILKEFDKGKSADEISREYEVSRPAFY
jgi:hypothetical protein